MKENLNRMGLDSSSGFRFEHNDAVSSFENQSFDKIVLDAPCSAMGVIARHPEIKWLRTPAQLEEVTRVQAQLLRSLWPVLDSGGMLLYATCSILRQENDRQIQQFLDAHRDAELAPISPGVGYDTGHGWQICPGEQEMDGFFYALLRKKN